MAASPSPTGFILDFDGTITTQDTISTLAKFGLAYQKSKGLDLTSTWDEILQSYGEDYSAHTSNYKPAKEERETLAAEIAYYRSLREVELRSFDRVSKSGIFKGIRRGDWLAFGREAVASGEVRVREGFGAFVDEINKSRGTWDVVSVNFSSHFIRGVISVIARPGNEEVEILANAPDQAGTLLGSDGKAPMTSSDAKLLSMQDLLQSWRDKSQTKGGHPKVVYIGDSGTDIECLTADGTVGIVMSDDGKSSLIETLKRIGVNVIHIEEYQERSSKPVYWVRDFAEIARSPLFTF